MVVVMVVVGSDVAGTKTKSYETARFDAVGDCRDRLLS